ncbi:hypothetical protein EV356DRAFT_500983 [Viridothelium virens]|uniref:Uncharacterized protein n=1 Tax=Viridothelium virens TaxID=1048519 RepID=A0A6A6HA82_VIRVR|nr:hypothetical protein EV356DRAFT_500983 [Viridothelium virens]
MSSIHIPSASLSTIILSSGEGQAYFASLDHSNHEVDLRGNPSNGTAPVERQLTAASNVRSGNTFTALSFDVRSIFPCGPS